MKKRYKRKISIILLVILTLAALYVIFKESIFKWLCNTEEIASSCYIVGILRQKEEDYDMARKFFKKACDLDYGLACQQMADIFEKNGDIINATIYYRKACKHDIKKACLKIPRKKINTQSP